MKVKLNLYISDAERFIKNPKDSFAYALQSGRWMDKEWDFAGEVEFDVDVDTGTLIKKAEAELNERIGKHTAAINVLENRKRELLALPSPS